MSIRKEPEESPDDGSEGQGPDAGLVLRARAGDDDAFCELVRLHHKKAIAVAYRLLGKKEDAEDVSQDAFAKAYRNLGQLEDPARFGGWLMRTVCNLALNYRRGRKLRMTASFDESLAGADDWRDPATGHRTEESDQKLGTSDAMALRGAIGDAIEQLPDKQRLALILFSVEGLPQKQVAEVLECSVELVKWNVFQARKKLKELLADYL